MSVFMFTRTFIHSANTYEQLLVAHHCSVCWECKFAHQIRNPKNGQ